MSQISSKMTNTPRSIGKIGKSRLLHVFGFLLFLIFLNISAAAVTITPAGSPTAMDNDYTRINNAIQTATSGTTIELSGTFNWAEPNAAASWALGSDGQTGGAFSNDDYVILAPANLNNVTITAASLGAATIQGPGDLSGANLEGVFNFFAGGTNQNWTISNIRFLDFDNAIGFYYDGGPTNIYSGTTIVNNYIRVARDLNATVAPVDVSQNIAIHFSFGANQTISGNTIEMYGDGVSDSANVNYSTEVGMQSNTSGGNVYDGLQITNNTLRVLNAQSSDPEVILGIWENAHAHSSNITISGNQFTNLSGGNNPALNLQRAFRVTSHSSATTSVTYSNNRIEGANIGFQWLAAANFAGNQPVKLISNTILNNATGVLVQSSGLANLSFNRIVGNSAAGVNNAGGTVNAENNWWGCNYGPGASGSGCSGTTNGTLGTVDSTPWLTLTTSASPNAVMTGGNSNITSSLTTNSDSVNTSGSGNIPNGTPASFAGTLGTVSPTSSTTTSGVTTTTFTAGAAAGSGSASTTVDGQTVSAPINITFSCNNVTIPANIPTLRNNQITVPINVDDTTGRGIISFDYRLTYNASVVTYLGTNQAGTLSNGMTITVNSTTPGTLIISGFGINPLSGAGTLINLNFFATGAIGTTSVMNFTSFAFNEGVPCVNTANGSVKIISGDVTGTITYANALSTTPVPYVTLNGAGSINVSTQTDLSGAYTLTGFGSGAYTVTPSKTGDVNGITSFDSARIAQHVVGLISLNSTQLLAADVSGNNTVTSFDAALIAQYVVAIPNSGSTGTWKFLPTSRSYSNLETNQTNQDYSAILMGEVSGNWAPPTMFAGLYEPVKKEEAVPQAVNVTAPAVNSSNGAIISYPINVSDTTGQGIISYQYDLTYNPSVLTPDAAPCEVTGTLSASMFPVCNPSTPGLIKVSVFGATPLSGAGVLMKLKFTATGANGTNSVMDVQNFLFNEDPMLLGTVTDGMVNLLFPPTAANVEVSGLLMSAGGEAVRNAVVILTDGTGNQRSVRSNSFGQFRFNEIPAGASYTLSVRAKGLNFSPQVISVNDSVTDLILIAEP